MFQPQFYKWKRFHLLQGRIFLLQYHDKVLGKIGGKPERYHCIEIPGLHNTTESVCI